jgi:hypothetical protein
MKQFEVRLPSGDLIEGLSGQDIVDLVRSGRITGNSLIRQQGQGRWHRVDAVPQITGLSKGRVQRTGTDTVIVTAIAQDSRVSRKAQWMIAWLVGGILTLFVLVSGVVVVALGGDKPGLPEGALVEEDTSIAPRAVGQRQIGRADEQSNSRVVVSDGGQTYFDQGTDLLWGKSGSKDEVAAVGLLRKAAEQGHAPAHFVLSTCYADGLGVNRNPPESLKLLRRAGELGDADLQETIGMMFIEGMRVQQDYAEGAMWLRRSAQGGSVMAQWFLGGCYYEGKGVEQSFVEAVKWYRKAAEQGNPRGQFSLGLCYAKGEGLAQSDAQAIRWWRKAAEGGHSEAKRVLRELGLQ